MRTSACCTKLLLHCPDTSELGVLTLACLPRFWLQSRMNLLPQELESQISQHSISLDCMEVRWTALLPPLDCCSCALALVLPEQC